MKCTGLGFAVCVAASFGLVFLFVGCEGAKSVGAHEMTAQTADHPMGCQKCYDQVRQVVTSHSKGAPWPKAKVFKRHACPECRGDMTIYAEDGKPMIKCPKCAPQGIACDRCLAPEASG